MKKESALPGDATAKSIVRHFQTEGFAGISEALIVRVGLRKGDRTAVELAFGDAEDRDKTPPAHEYFEIRPYGHFSDFRSFAAAKAAIQTDFTVRLRRGLPRIFFDPAPVFIDDALASGTKYDMMVKLRDNVGEQAFAVLLNDPDSSLFEYLGTHRDSELQQIVEDIGATSASFAPESDQMSDLI